MGPQNERRGSIRSRACGEELQKREDCENGKLSIEADGAERDVHYLVPAWMLLCFFRTHGISPG